MRKFWPFLSAPSTVLVLGFCILAVLLLLACILLEISVLWALLSWAGVVGAAALIWYWRRRRRARAAAKLGAVLEQDAAGATLTPAARAETELLRKRMLAAIATIKSSKLGQFTGKTALYELPWYMIIGNPAAGKSSAIAHSGLQFPFADGAVVHGVGGTRNCDWFFTTDGVLLDTAGRYSELDADRAEWFGFLGLLKKYRKRAPINGVIIAVSIAELATSRPERAIELARSLRQRVQEVIEQLGVHAPLYLVFTKVDLITGFGEFFADAEAVECERVWGATQNYRPGVNNDILAFFEQRFDELCAGLREMSVASMTVGRGARTAPGVFSFPLEFQTLKPALRAFIATLFEENPYQFKPRLRGFYFTSALQEGSAVVDSSARLIERFRLTTPKPAGAPEPETSLEAPRQHGYFLLKLFRQVIFADKDLVAQYASPSRVRLRYLAFFGAATLLGLALAGWSWSFMANRQLVANVQADLEHALRLQEKRLDLQARFEALAVLQDRIEQLDQYRQQRPLALGFGLYQGEALARKLREQYFGGLREVMLKPVAQSLEGFLAEVNGGADKLEPMSKPPQASAAGAAQQFKDASPANVEDAYNALKTYLMLSDPERAEAAHLNDQLTRFWRAWLESNRGAMPREQMIRSAERMISFYLAQIGEPAWPRIEAKLTLIDQSRESLRRVVRGMPARERVYAEVRARAATRFPSITVARIVGEPDKELVLGSYAVSGAFTREAWEKFVQPAFKEASTRELQSADWVLKSASKDDLTLEGSPEQIQKALTELYKNDYAREWARFLQGVSVRELGNFDSAVAAMNRLGDPLTSPLSKVLASVYEQSAWDTPSLREAVAQRAQRGAIEWIRETVLRQAPSQVSINVGAGAPPEAVPGPVGREFSGLARLMASKDKDATMMRGYMDTLSRLRARLGQIKNQGDTGPGAKQLMQQTLDGSGSELADALKYVDEQMLTGMTDQQKQALRPLLVRPLMQAFAVIVKPTEAEINKVWVAQVLEPFQKTLALKYPFAPDARVEASGAEIAQFFGPEGAVAKLFTTTIGPLVLRRGDVVSAKTWADMGITLAPPVLAAFPGWVAPLGANGMPAAASTASAPARTQFDLQALGAPGASEFTIEVDGQTLRWRGQPQPWVQMVWPNAQGGTPGARISAILADGRSVVLLDEPGHFGLKKMIDAARRKRKDGGVFELSWDVPGVSVTANLKIIASQSAPSAGPASQGIERMKLPETIVGGASAPAIGPTAPAPATAPGTLAAAGTLASTGAAGLAGAPAAASGAPR
ncbi:MAG: type VI secretion system membrane subunit TssM [Pseudomonadota bacterium]